MTNELNDLSKKIINDTNLKLSEINSDLSIGRLGYSDGYVHNIGLSLRLKGNKDIVAKIVRLGFRKERREKRGDSFFVVLSKDVYYDTYAIFQGVCGLRANLYIDNYRDFKRNQIFGSFDNTPILVNRMGGHMPFDEKIDKKNGFLYFKKVLEDEEPLTREERFPKNNENFFYGWVDPLGNTYSCGFEDHYYCAEAICQELKLSEYRPEKELEDRRWMRVSRPAPYTPDNKGKRTVYISDYEKGFTKRQKDLIYEIGADSDPTVAWLLRRDDY